MPDFKKMFVFENNTGAVIQDNTGAKVSFESVADLERCSGLDFTGKWYIGYEPDIEFFQDSEDPDVTPEMIPYTPYEDLISSISVLQTRKDDHTYGLSLEDAHDMAESEALSRLQQYYYAYAARGEDSDPVNQRKANAKLSKSLRREAKGTETSEDIQRLDNNDTLDDWFDDIERDMEDQGEAWIEDPTRTTEELKAFDPEADIVWTLYPL